MNSWINTFAVAFVLTALLLSSLLLSRILRMLTEIKDVLRGGQDENREIARRLMSVVDDGLSGLAEEIRDAIKKRHDPF